MSLLLGWGAYARDKNTSARLCAKKAGGAYARGGAYLRDTTVNQLRTSQMGPCDLKGNYSSGTREHENISW